MESVWSVAKAAQKVIAGHLLMTNALKLKAAIGMLPNNRDRLEHTYRKAAYK